MITSVRVPRATVIVLLLAAADASANPASLVPSAADANDLADLNLHVDYEYAIESASILREAVGETTDPLAPLPRRRDLAFQQFRHTIIPRAELGIYHDTWVSFAIPITLTQVRELKLGDGVTRETSTTVEDGILPAEGFDARDPGVAPPGDFMFRGIKRSGIDQLHLGIGVAPMNQAKDSTKPTWKLGGELLLPAGRVMRFDPLKPEAETGVGRGITELRFWTSVAKRVGAVEGWYHMFWQVPIAASKFSEFEDPGFGARNVMPGQTAGASAGLELIAIDDKLTGNRISLDLGGRVVGHFEGRDYTELWEVFRLAGDARTGGPLVLDSDPGTADVQPLSHPGITNHENYLETAGKIAIAAQLGKHVQFSAAVDLVWQTDHLISFADAGVDGDDDNVVVNPGTNEVNPLHAPRIDLVGHRYISEDNFDFVLGVQMRVLY